MAALLFLIEGERAFRRERVFRDRTNPLDVYTDEQLISRYRFPRQSLLNLIDAVGGRLQRPTGRSHPLPVPAMVLSTLRILAKGDFQSEVADIHGISQPSMSRVLMNVVDAINSSLHNINFPSQTDEIIQIKAQFMRVANFPNVVGAVDGTLIPILGMSAIDEHVFVSRKGFHAINVQGVVTADLKFINIVSRYGGATHDAYILSNSGIPALMERLEGGGWLLGDSGYPLRPWLMTPIPHPTTPQEERYNSSHSKTRNCVERTFGVLKSRFRCLHRTGGALAYSPEKCVRLIECCCRLHNKAIGERLPTPVDGDIPLFSGASSISSSDNSLNATNIRGLIIRRF